MHPEEAAALLGKLKDTELHRAARCTTESHRRMDRDGSSHRLPPATRPGKG